MSSGSSPSVANAVVTESSHLDTMARKVLEEIAVAGTCPDAALDEYIRVLSEYRKKCESQRNYREADLVQHVLRHLRLEEESRHVRALTEHQELEKQGLEEAHLMEFQIFNRSWNQKIDAFEEHQLESESNLLERHSVELAQFHSKMTEELPRRVKYSKDLLQLRNIQEMLAKQRSYAQAQRIKDQADALENREREDLRREREEIYCKKEATLLARHRSELLAMRKRMERNRLELERGRRKELEMLLQRYNNVKRGLEGQQNIIKAKTGNILMKHARNKKTDCSGSGALLSNVIGNHATSMGRSFSQRRTTPQRSNSTTGSALPSIVSGRSHVNAAANGNICSSVHNSDVES